MSNKDWKQEIEERELGADPTLKADGFDDAILGIHLEHTPPRIVYDKQKMIAILQQDDMTYEEAVEFLEFNVWSAYVGAGTPIYIDTE